MKNPTISLTPLSAYYHLHDTAFHKHLKPLSSLYISISTHHLSESSTTQKDWPALATAPILTLPPFTTLSFIVLHLSFIALHHFLPSGIIMEIPQEGKTICSIFKIIFSNDHEVGPHTAHLLRPQQCPYCSLLPQDHQEETLL